MLAFLFPRVDVIFVIQNWNFLKSFRIRFPNSIRSRVSYVS